MKAESLHSFELFPLHLIEHFQHLFPSAGDSRLLFAETMAFLQKRAWTKGGILLSLDSQGKFSVREVYGLPLEGLRGSCCEPTEEIRRCLCQARPLVLEDIEGDPLLEPLLPLFGAHALFLWTPLRAAGRSTGLLGTLHLDPPWGQDQLSTAMGWVASLLSPALFLCSFWEELGLDELLERKLDHAMQQLASLQEEGAELFSEVLALVEKRLILAALRKTKNVQTAAARLLGINRNTLRKKIREHGIEV